MKSRTHGGDTLAVEVTNISRHGLWILVGEKELFLPFSEFPWFEKATVAAIMHVQFSEPDHLYWPDLDVDLSVEHPDRYPLIARSDG